MDSAPPSSAKRPVSASAPARADTLSLNLNLTLRPAAKTAFSAAAASVLFAGAAEDGVPAPAPAPAAGGSAEHAPPDEAWLQAGLVVRVRNAELGDGAYWQRIGIVRRVVDVFGGEVHMVEGGGEGGDVVRLDQDECETVVPPVGESVLVVRGLYKDLRARVVRAGAEVEVELEEGARRGHRLLLPASLLCRHIAVSRGPQ